MRTGTRSPIKVPLTDEDGFPILDERGRAQIVTYQLPGHAAMAPVSEFDPTGLVPSPCEHGLPEHPLDRKPIEKIAGFVRSYIRAKYLGADFRCPVCRGEPRPADLTTPRTQPPMGEGAWSQ